MIVRRSFIAATASLPLYLRPAFAEPSGARFDPVEDWGFTPPTFDALGASGQLTGSKPPRQSEIAQAFDINSAAPRGVSPLKIAQYYENLTLKNEDNQLYNEEWPLDGRANPVIVGFFAATFTTPSKGDQTSWCAAFVNYCLMLSHKPMTQSPLSGSFRHHRNFPTTDDPEPGDIVVFESSNPELSRQGFGHVAFFLSRTADHVEVLGGNQRGQTASTGAVTKSLFPNNGKSIKLLGFRHVGR